MDNENKNPDALNKDEELTAVLKRLSELLDSSVSLEEAIALAKKSKTEEAGGGTVLSEEKIDSTSEDVGTDDADTEATGEEHTTADTDDVVAEETAEEVASDSAVLDESEESVEAEEEADDEELSDVAAAHSTIAHIINRISKAEKEIADNTSNDDEPSAEEVIDEPAEEADITEDVPAVQKKRSPFGILELIESMKNSDEADDIPETVGEAIDIGGAEEDSEEATEEASEAAEYNEDEEQTILSEPAESGETVKASSKIFGDLLACFEGKKIPEELLASDSIIVERQETDTAEYDEAEEEYNEEGVDLEMTEENEQTEETEAADTDSELTGFIPLAHEAPDEKDELFSEIFSEERSERRNKEKDRKKWQKSPGDANAFVLGVFDWLEVIVLSAAFALILFTFVMRLAVVDGDSMNHTLHDKEVLIISDLMYTPDNGDIIVFSSPNYPEPIVKRVIATSGQTVDIDFETWTVTVDGKVVPEGYINRVPGSMNRSDMEFPLTVPEGKIFVMGDNRNDSLDSRNSRIGFVDERYILGEVKIRLFPIDRFGKVN